MENDREKSDSKQITRDIVHNGNKDRTVIEEGKRFEQYNKTVLPNLKLNKSRNTEQKIVNDESSTIFRENENDIK